MVENVNAVAGSVIDLQDYAIPAEAPPSGELGKDAFLKLLVAQLKYQDPLEPSTSEEFIATTAQFTVVEKLDELTKQGANTALVNSLTTASTLVGREVTANRSGVEVTAVVQQSKIVSGAVVLETDQGAMQLNEIVSVGPAPTTAPPIAPTTSIPVATAPSDTASSPEPDSKVEAAVEAESTAEAAPLPESGPEDESTLHAEPVSVEASPPPPEASAVLTPAVTATPAVTDTPPVTVAPAVQPEQLPVPDDLDAGPPATSVGSDAAIDTPAEVTAAGPPAEQVAGSTTSAAQGTALPTVPVTSATPAAVEDADHEQSEPFNPFDGG